MLLIHNTTYENYLRISENRKFKIIKSNELPRFGYGIYFSKDKNNYYDSLQCAFYCTIEKECKILKLSYLEICNLLPCKYRDIEGEEGIPEIKQYTIDNGYEGLEITYTDKSQEVVIYNVNKIKIISSILKANQ
jgi:hypothetical protein